MRFCWQQNSARIQCRSSFENIPQFKKVVCTNSPLLDLRKMVTQKRSVNAIWWLKSKCICDIEWNFRVSVVISKETLRYPHRVAPLWVLSTVRKIDDCEVRDPSQSSHISPQFLVHFSSSAHGYLSRVDCTLLGGKMIFGMTLTERLGPMDWCITVTTRPIMCGLRISLSAQKKDR